MVTKFDFGENTVVPSSAFFPSLATTLGITRIGGGAFRDTLIIFITIPRHVQILCSACFVSCKSLSSIVFENESELTRIETNAFWSCSSLKSITIPRHVQILCSACFFSCKSLSSISFENESELTRIESIAFWSCSSLKSITIPQYVDALDGSAFSGIPDILISIDSNNLHFVVESDLIFDSSKSRLTRYFGHGSNVDIPCYVQIVCSECFSYSESLSSILFENESELTRIESDAFHCCSSLKSITIPRHVQIFCSGCFSHCDSLSSIVFENESELAHIGGRAFDSCSSLESMTIPRHVQILCSACFLYCTSLSSVLFENESELTRIESDAFDSCSSLKSITIPRQVQILCSSCFSHCDSLSSISFENESELRHIETEAFIGTCLHCVVVPEKVSFIADDAFPRGCAVTLAGVRDADSIDVCQQCPLRNV
jgi:predicted transcriptional regulator